MANSFSCASVSGLLDKFNTHLEVGAIVVVVELEKYPLFCTVDVIAVELKFLVPL